MTDVKLPEPTWIALDTPGADFDVTFVKNMTEAHHMIEGLDEKDCTKLFTAAQLTAAVMAERAERWRPIDSYKQRPEDGQRIFYYFEPFERWYNGVYVDGRVESQSGFSSFLPECPFWIPEPTVEPPAEDGDVHEQD